MIQYKEQALRDDATFDSRFPGSPIAIIPHELLAETFCLCVCPESGSIAPQWWSTMNSRMVPWRLMRVCKRWRDIAVKTPALWSHIIFKATCSSSPRVAQRTFRRMLATLQMMLQRSGDIPLCLQLTLNYLPEDAKNRFPQWSRILEQLSLHSRRWKAICFPCCDDILELLESVKDLKLLEVVELDPNKTTRDHDRKYSILSGCQSLRRITLNGYNASSIAIPQVPWMNIVGYDSVGKLDRHHLQLIGSMPRLTRLQVRGPTMNSITRPTRETIICKELKQLYITSGEPEVQGLVLPNLEKIYSYDMQRCSRTIVPMLVQSGYPLKQLTISSRFRPLHTDLCALLEAVPLLTSLTLVDRCEDGWTVPVIQRLALIEPPSQRVCTHLRYLFIQPHPGQPLPSFIEALSAVLDARRTNPSNSVMAGFVALQSVNIQLDTFPGDRIMVLARSLLDDKVVRIQIPAAGRKKYLILR